MTTTVTERLAFLQAIRTSPEEDTPRLVFADWLDEHREPAAASDQRRAVHVRRVCRNPDDDAPRLLYAEWLDRQSESARAEFIRVQCELARIEAGNGTPEFWQKLDEYHRREGIAGCQCPRCDLRRRERELLPLVRDAGAFVVRGLSENVGIEGGELLWWPSGDSRGVGVVARGTVSRGFVSGVRLSTTAFLGGSCWRCRDQPGWAFVGSRLRRCPDCKGETRGPGLAGPIAGAHPVTEWRLTDLEPTGLVGSWYWWFTDDVPGPGTNRHWLPTVLMRYWEPSGLVPPNTAGEFSTIDYTAADAHAALSRACAAYARKLAGLPPL